MAHLREHPDDPRDQFLGPVRGSLVHEPEHQRSVTVDELVLDFAEHSTTDSRQARDWSVTVTPRLGARWAALEWIDLKGGVFVDPSPVPSSTLGPSSPDSLRIGTSLGASIAFSEVVGLEVGGALVVFTGNTSDAGVAYDGLAILAGASLRVEL